MPTYEYECPKCRKQLELQQSINNRVNPKCFEEGCDGVDMDTIISTSTFILKGSCWAKDGYSKQ
jgi:putative FmdB family regulatory protein